MKLFLLYNSIDSPWGGINTFFANFESHAQNSALLELVDTPEEADIALTAGHYLAPGKTLKKYQLRNVRSGRNLNHPMGFFFNTSKVKTIFRVDGLRLFYSGKNSSADKTLIKNIGLADAIVFQSNFSKECFDKLNISYPSNYKIIHNGADFPYKNEIIPQKIDDELIMVSNSWSQNKNKGFETIADFSTLEKVRVMHIGQWPEDIPTKNVQLLGKKKKDEIPTILEKAHYLLFPSKNEACPNVVSEALASGLPTLFHKSGGTPEICKEGESGLALPEKKEEYAAFIEKCIDSYPVLVENISRRLDVFLFKTCFDKYLLFLESLTQ